MTIFGTDESNVLSTQTQNWIGTAFSDGGHLGIEIVSYFMYSTTQSLLFDTYIERMNIIEGALYIF